MEQIQKDIKRFGAWGSEIQDAHKSSKKKAVLNGDGMIGKTKRQILRFYVSTRNFLKSLLPWH